jgi:hydrogenase/urease accessory protein HupE
MVPTVTTGVRQMDTHYASRKFILSMIIQLAAVAGLFTGELTGMEFSSISGAVIAAYSLANSICHYVDAKHV